MRDFTEAGLSSPRALRTRPFAVFVHHQGRGHATRIADLVHALPDTRPVALFTARAEIFPALPPNARVIEIPSLFERRGDEAAGMDHIPTPDIFHCAPLGWGGIREAMAEIAGFFARENPALMICDVSAEIAHLARLCSVPHVCVLQHGDRRDAGHRAAYAGAAGLLAPFHADLAQPDWSASMRARTHFAPGLGVATALAPRAEARARLGLDPKRAMALVMSGGGGNGITQAPLGVAARAFPDIDWRTIGAVQRDWHATEPANLTHMGWVENAPDWIAAADLVIASAGNTTCHQILAAAKPWIVVPEWRYFDEQEEKARALARAGAAVHLPALPASAHRWRAALRRAIETHDPARQRRLVAADAAAGAAAWLEGLAAALWRDTTHNTKETLA